SGGTGGAVPLAIWAADGAAADRTAAVEVFGMKVPSNVPCDPVRSLESDRIVEFRSVMSARRWNGKSPGSSWTLGRGTALNCEPWPGLIWFVTRISAPEW